MKSIRSAILLVPCLLLPACAAPLTKDFNVRALDTGGRELKCLIELDRKFGESKEKEQFTPTTLTVTFPSKNEPVPIKLHAVEKDAAAPDGFRVPEPTEQLEFLRQTRQLYYNDAKDQLLIMVRNSEWRHD